MFYGYTLVAIAVGIQIVAWGTYNSFGVFFNALLTEFEWSRATLSGAASLGQLMVGFGAVIFGNLSDRLSPRRLIAIGGLVAGLGYCLMSGINSIWQLYLYYGVVVGLGLSGTDIILLSTTARWFVRRRGMMSGIVKMGTGIGILIMPIWLNWLISTLQWRSTYIVTGIVIALCLLVGAQFLVRDPSQKGQFPDGQKLPQRLDKTTGGNSLTFAMAVKTRKFALLCVAYFTVFFCTCVMVVHIVPYVVDLGHSTSIGALVLAVIGAASIIGRFAMGTIGDRFGSKRALMVCFIILILVFIWLQVSQQLWHLFLFAIFYGFAHGGFYAIISPVIAELFGLRSHGVIFGVIVFVGSIGGALGPVAAGYIFDVSSSYHLAFVLLLVFSIIGFLSIIATGSLRKVAEKGIPTVNNG